MSQTKSDGLVTVGVKINGSAIPDTVQIHAIDVEQSINRISTAVIAVIDGNPSQENFAVSASSTFVPGNSVDIEVGYNNTNKLVYSGIVVKQNIRIDEENGPLLEVVCKDKAIKMTVGRKSAAYGKTKDSDAISKLISAAGLSSSVTATTVEMPELVQYYTTDWDFMLSRAEINSMVVSTINGKVSVFNPGKDTTSVLTLTYGDNLISFHAGLNSVTQFSQVKASAWNYQNQTLINATAANSLAGPGNLSSKKLSEVIGLSDYELQTTAAEDKDELTGWANAQMLKSALSKILGEAKVQGTYIEPGKYLTLKGLGPRFDGDHFISSIQHSVVAGNWLTHINIGLPVNWFFQEHDVTAPAAAGLLPGIQGIFNGTVKKIYDDPDSEYRILVDVPLYNSQGEGVWARLSNFYSTNGKGVFFLPEVGDEVILGFLNQDPRYPVILGSLYSQKNKPYQEFTPDEENTLKGIVTESKLRILFNDVDQILSFITPGNNSMVFDDKNKQIQIKDENGNSITMSSSGIGIKSPTNINIEATQNVTIKGTTGVDIQASGGDISSKAININAAADMQYSAKGNTAAQVQAGLELTLKGAMVMIN